jgi:class 3 adenylate cyclase
MPRSPETRYARNGDVFLAYQVVGEGPVDLLLVPGGYTHVELGWEIQGFASFLRRLARFSRLILFDKRGTGLSDGIPGTLEERADDALAVLDAAGSERAVVLGVSEGGPMSILLAASHPERVRGLVLYGTGALFRSEADYAVGPILEYPVPVEHWEHWGSPATAMLFLEFFAPSLADDPEFVDIWGRYLRSAVSPGTAKAFIEINRAIDVRPVLAALRVPTLVLHHAADRVILLSQGEHLAAHIPGARLAVLPGEDHLPFVGNTAPQVTEIEHFVRDLDEAERTDRVLMTVLLTDLVGSTEQAARLGDRAWRDLLARLEAAALQEVTRHRGRRVNTTGDGLIAVFDGPARAVRAGQALIETARRHDLQLRVGAHVGEIELRGDDVAGINVHVAARIMALAGSGQMLVSRTVRDLVAGSGLRFESLGPRELRGVDGAWELFAAV